MNHGHPIDPGSERFHAEGQLVTRQGAVLQRVGLLRACDAPRLDLRRVDAIALDKEENTGGIRSREGGGVQLTEEGRQ